MKLTPARVDAIKEIANIGVSKAATQLSSLLNDTIELNVPEIELVSLDNLPKSLVETDEHMVIVHQGLGGFMDGRAYLVFQTGESEAIVKVLFGSEHTPRDMDLRVYEYEAMLEIGNIIISTCVSTLANMLGEDISLSVPGYTEKNVMDFVIDAGDKECQVMIMKTVLSASRRSITGTFIIVLTMLSAEAFLMSIDKFLGAETQQ